MFTLIEQIYGVGFDRVLPVKNSDFVIMPTIGQITDGYLLTCPKPFRRTLPEMSEEQFEDIYPYEHFDAFSDLSEEQFTDVYLIMDMIRQFYRDVFGTGALFFEHGCSSTRGIQGGASITHAHLHSMPATDLESDDMFALLKSDANNTIMKIEHLRDLKAAFKDHESYVLFVATNGDMYMILGKEKWMSQYMRKIAGLVYGNLNWDWKNKMEKEPNLIKLRDFLFAYDLENRHFCVRREKALK